jgi:uncharacterized membrane protein
MNRVNHLWSNLRASFWFLPSLIVAFSTGLALGLIEVDSSGSRDWMDSWPRLFGASAAGARGMLATIAGSMTTVVGVTFSMTLVALTMASSQYTSRVLRNFMSDRVTQVVLGIFAGIFTYCLIVLRTIRGDDEGRICSEPVGGFQRRAGHRGHRDPDFLHSSHRVFDPGLEHYWLGDEGNPGGGGPAFPGETGTGADG